MSPGTRKRRRNELTKEEAKLMQQEKKFIYNLVTEFGKIFKRAYLCGRLPATKFKFGGNTATYYWNTHSIEFRWDVWKNLTLGGKRMLVIHECIHACGSHHSGKRHYTNTLDLATIVAYKKIWGEDEEFRTMMANIEEFVESLKIPLSKS
jgi:hypothetical protein